MSVNNTLSDNQLWPEITPYKEGYLRVSDVHEIHYSLYGNKGGEPVFFLHGGPGCGTESKDARWFDPDRYLIVLHDQRGSGQSKPRAEIKDNTPGDLVDDVEKLKNHLKVRNPIILFGGSWGSTVSLLYAEKYPVNVSRMILRGIFLCSYKDQDHLYSADGGGRFSPEAYEEFTNALPPGPERVQEKLHKLLEESSGDERKKWCLVQAKYEYSFFNLPEEDVEKALSDFDSVWPEMLINSHYQANRFFLEDDQIIKNVAKIKHISTVIINGARDLICPPVFAWTLHKKLTNSKIILVPNEGHLSSEPGIRKALLEAMKE